MFMWTLNMPSCSGDNQPSNGDDSWTASSFSLVPNKQFRVQGHLWHRITSSPCIAYDQSEACIFPRPLRSRSSLSTSLSFLVPAAYAWFRWLLYSDLRTLALACSHHGEMHLILHGFWPAWWIVSLRFSRLNPNDNFQLIRRFPLTNRDSHTSHIRHILNNCD